MVKFFFFSVSGESKREIVTNSYQMINIEKKAVNAKLKKDLVEETNKLASSNP